MPSPLRILSLRLAIEYTLWTPGVSLLLVFAGGRALGEIERRQAIHAFTASKPAAITAAVDNGGRIDVGPSPAMAPATASAWATLPSAPGDPDRREQSPARVREHAESLRAGLVDTAAGAVIELESASRHGCYRIDALSIVDPHDLSPLQASSGPVLTLITCHPFWFVGNAPRRFIVRAVAVQ